MLTIFFDRFREGMVLRVCLDRLGFQISSEYFVQRKERNDFFSTEISGKISFFGSAIYSSSRSTGELQVSGEKQEKRENQPPDVKSCVSWCPTAQITRLSSKNPLEKSGFGAIVESNEHSKSSGFCTEPALLRHFRAAIGPNRRMWVSDVEIKYLCFVVRVQIGIRTTFHSTEKFGVKSLIKTFRTQRRHQSRKQENKIQRRF